MEPEIDILKEVLLMLENLEFKSRVDKQRVKEVIKWIKEKLKDENKK